jgi:hypothetical protein
MTSPVRSTQYVPEVALGNRRTRTVHQHIREENTAGQAGVGIFGLRSRAFRGGDDRGSAENID